MAQDTSGILASLRSVMQNKKYVTQVIEAYIVPSHDAHQNEMKAPSDERLEYVSNYSGDLGTAVITMTSAALWIKDIYVSQAMIELDQNWQIMKASKAETPSIGVWLSDNLPAKSMIGVDPKMISYREWKNIESDLRHLFEITLIPIESNLIDVIWKTRPEQPNEPLFPLSLKYSGVSSAQKLENIRTVMKKRNTTALIITALDEIAWLFNMRGCDFKYVPVFYAYTFVTMKEIYLFLKEPDVKPDIKDNFNENKIKPKLQKYQDFDDFLQTYNVEEGTKVWMSSTSSYSLGFWFTEEELLFVPSPILVMKSIKNKIEIENMKLANLKDSAAICCFLHWIETEVENKSPLTESIASNQIIQFWKEQENFVGPCFGTTSAVDANAAVQFHYTPSGMKDVTINKKSIYLFNCGAHYLEGGTDLTRTIHFGTPSEHEKYCFTRVLKGVINFGNAVFPHKTLLCRLDALARKFLWEFGFDYLHYTGHGIGMYLNIHEGPMSTAIEDSHDDSGLQEGMFLTYEPGYYEIGKFGVRIENVVTVVKAHVKNKEDNFLAFENVTFVPIQTKFIDMSQMTQLEVKYINEYHRKCRELVGPLLVQQGKTEVSDWLNVQTQPIG